jgi:hypothetical protein
VIADSNPACNGLCMTETGVVIASLKSSPTWPSLHLQPRIYLHSLSQQRRSRACPGRSCSSNRGCTVTGRQSAPTQAARTWMPVIHNQAAWAHVVCGLVAAGHSQSSGGTASSRRPAVCRCSQRRRCSQARQNQCMRHSCCSCPGCRHTASWRAAQLWCRSTSSSSRLVARQVIGRCT